MLKAACTLTLCTSNATGSSAQRRLCWDGGSPNALALCQGTAATTSMCPPSARALHGRHHLVLRADVAVVSLLGARGEMSGNCSASQLTSHLCPLLVEGPTKAALWVLLLLGVYCGVSWGRSKEEGSVGVHHGTAAGGAWAEGVGRQSTYSRGPCAR